MNISYGRKESFSVIGKEGSTNNGENFIDHLWAEANGHFNEIAHLAKKDESDQMVGIWGAMSDFSRQFKPWENNFTQGLYLAGIEVLDQAEAPPGWTKWTIPTYEYLSIQVEKNLPETFKQTLNFMNEHNLMLAGAVHDYICPQEEGQTYLFFPIKKI